MRAVFGLSFGEFVVIGIVALVVVGPKNLPTLMRTAAQTLARLRRMAMDIRAESGIDEALELDGLRAEIQRLRSLTDVESLLDSATSPPAAARRPSAEGLAFPERSREYPAIGPDSYGALPETEPASLDDAPGVSATNPAHGGGPTTVPAMSPVAMRAAASAERRTDS